MDEKRVNLNDKLVENDDMTHDMYLFLYEECQKVMRLRERTIHLALDIYLRTLRRRDLRAFQGPDYLLASLLLAVKCDDLDALIPRASDLIQYFQVTSNESGINTDLLSEVNQVNAESDIDPIGQWQEW